MLVNIKICTVFISSTFAATIKSNYNQFSYFYLYKLYNNTKKKSFLKYIYYNCGIFLSSSYPNRTCVYFETFVRVSNICQLLRMDIGDQKENHTYEVRSTVYEETVKGIYWYSERKSSFC